MFASAARVLLSGCGLHPAYQVVEGLPPARNGTVESVREVVEEKDPSGAGCSSATVGA